MIHIVARYTKKFLNQLGPKCIENNKKYVLIEESNL